MTKARELIEQVVSGRGPRAVLTETEPVEFWRRTDRAAAEQFISQALGAGHKVYALDFRPRDPSGGVAGSFMMAPSVHLYTAASDAEAHTISDAWWKRNMGREAQFRRPPVAIHHPADLGHLFKW
jgi:hypothetical protein